MNSKIPVLLDFWGPGCGPCNMIGPMIDEIAAEYEGKDLVGKINTAQQRLLAAQFRIMSVPTIMFFEHGKPVDVFKGIIPKPNMTEILDVMIEDAELGLTAPEEQKQLPPQNNNNSTNTNSGGMQINYTVTKS